MSGAGGGGGHPARLVDYLLVLGPSDDEPLAPVAVRERSDSSEILPITDLRVEYSLDAGAGASGGYSPVCTVDGYACNMNHGRWGASDVFVLESRREDSVSESDERRSVSRDVSHEHDALGAPEPTQASAASDCDDSGARVDGSDTRPDAAPLHGAGLAGVGPITGVHVMFGDKAEEVPAGYTLVEGNLNKGAVGRTISLCVERDPVKPPLIELLVLNRSRKNACPPDFAVIEKNLNAGGMGDEMFFCVRYGVRKENRAVAYVPRLISRYPTRDYGGRDGAEACPVGGVTGLCFPRGMLLTRKPKLPTFFTFVVTGTRGQEFYGAALFCYEPLEPQHLPQSVHDPSLGAVASGVGRAGVGVEEEEDASHSAAKSDPGTLYCPKCVCILSHWPFYDAFKTFLNQLFRIVVSPSPVPLERYLGQLMHKVPLPRPGVLRVRYEIGHAQVVFQRPLPVHLPLRDFSLRQLFRFFSIENVIRLLELILAEKKILLFSNSLATLTPVAEALRVIIFPLQWQCSFVPVLPSDADYVLRAPFPFVVGMHRNFLVHVRVPKSVVMVDIDRNLVDMSAPTTAGSVLDLDEMDAADREPPTPLPMMLRQRLANELRQYANIFASVDHSRSSMCLYLPEDMDGDAGDHFDERHVTLSFLRVMVALLASHREFLRPPTSADQSASLDDLFDTRGFVDNHPLKHRAFLRQLTQRQMFMEFIVQRTFHADQHTMHGLFFFDWISAICTDVSGIPAGPSGGVLASSGSSGGPSSMESGVSSVVTVGSGAGGGAGHDGAGCANAKKMVVVSALPGKAQGGPSFVRQDSQLTSDADEIAEERKPFYLRSSGAQVNVSLLTSEKLTNIASCNWFLSSSAYAPPPALQDDVYGTQYSVPLLFDRYAEYTGQQYVYPRFPKLDPELFDVAAVDMDPSFQRRGRSGALWDSLLDIHAEEDTQDDQTASGGGGDGGDAPPRPARLRASDALRGRDELAAEMDKRSPIAMADMFSDLFTSLVELVQVYRDGAGSADARGYSRPGSPRLPAHAEPRSSDSDHVNDKDKDDGSGDEDGSSLSGSGSSEPAVVVVERTHAADGSVVIVARTQEMVQCVYESWFCLFAAHTRCRRRPRSAESLHSHASVAAYRRRKGPVNVHQVTDAERDLMAALLELHRMMELGFRPTASVMETICLQSVALPTDEEFQRMYLLSSGVVRAPNLHFYGQCAKWLTEAVVEEYATRDDVRADVERARVQREEEERLKREEIVKKAESMLASSGRQSVSSGDIPSLEAASSAKEQLTPDRPTHVRSASDGVAAFRPLDLLGAGGAGGGADASAHHVSPRPRTQAAAQTTTTYAAAAPTSMSRRPASMELLVMCHTCNRELSGEEALAGWLCGADTMECICLVCGEANKPKLCIDFEHQSSAPHEGSSSAGPSDDSADDSADASDSANASASASDSASDSDGARSIMVDLLHPSRLLRTLESRQHSARSARITRAEQLLRRPYEDGAADLEGHDAQLLLKHVRVDEKLFWNFVWYFVTRGQQLGKMNGGQLPFGFLFGEESEFEAMFAPYVVQCTPFSKWRCTRSSDDDMDAKRAAHAHVSPPSSTSTSSSSSSSSGGPRTFSSAMTSFEAQQHEQQQKQKQRQASAQKSHRVDAVRELLEQEQLKAAMVKFLASRIDIRSWSPRGGSGGRHPERWEKEFFEAGMYTQLGKMYCALTASPLDGDDYAALVHAYTKAWAEIRDDPVHALSIMSAAKLADQPPAHAEYAKLLGAIVDVFCTHVGDTQFAPGLPAIKTGYLRLCGESSRVLAGVPTLGELLVRHVAWARLDADLELRSDAVGDGGDSGDVGAWFVDFCKQTSHARHHLRFWKLTQDYYDRFTGVAAELDEMAAGQRERDEPLLEELIGLAAGVLRHYVTPDDSPVHLSEPVRSAIHARFTASATGGSSSVTDPLLGMRFSLSTERFPPHPSMFDDALLEVFDWLALVYPSFVHRVRWMRASDRGDMSAGELADSRKQKQKRRRRRRNKMKQEKEVVGGTTTPEHDRGSGKRKVVLKSKEQKAKEKESKAVGKDSTKIKAKARAKKKKKKRAEEIEPDEDAILLVTKAEDDADLALPMDAPEPEPEPEHEHEHEPKPEAKPEAVAVVESEEADAGAVDPDVVVVGSVDVDNGVGKKSVSRRTPIRRKAKHPSASSLDGDANELELGADVPEADADAGADVDVIGEGDIDIDVDVLQT